MIKTPLRIRKIEQRDYEQAEKCIREIDFLTQNRNFAGQEMAKHLNLGSYVLDEQRKAAFDTMMEIEFEDEDLLNDREYIEAVIEDYDQMQDGKFAPFCSMITYCLRGYFMQD